MNFIKLLAIWILVTFFTTAFAQNVPDTTVLDYDSLSNKIAANQIHYKTLSAKARMTWNDGESEQEFQANIRVNKDSLIWMSLGIMGIEGMRVLINPDSFRLINKLTNEYAIRDFAYLQTWLLFPVSFNMLQEIIEGQKISIREKGAMATREDSSTVLYSESDKLFQKIWVNSENYTFEKILLKDKLLKQDMTITFDGYHPAQPGRQDSLSRVSGEGQAILFPYRRNITIRREASTVTLNMEIIKINFDGELTFPFEVSEKYKRIE